MATFTWDGSTLDTSGSNAPDSIEATLEQNGSILRTITGNGQINLVWSKWQFSFSWNQAPDEVADGIESMIAYGGNVVYTDSVVGTHTVMLVDDNASIESTVFGVSNVSAIFTEAL